MSAREIILTDPTFVAKPQRSAAERFALRFIRDERDLPFVWLMLQMTLVLPPIAVFLYWPGMFRWWMAPLYWALLFGVFFDRYVLMLHNTSHRQLFKREYGWAKFYIPWVLGPFCGESPETYFIHHITMHHAEGNLPRDLSSTMKYQRDSVSDFLRYWADFIFLTMLRLARYQLRKKRPRLFTMMVVGELSLFAAIALGLWLSPGPTVTVFLVPLIMCRSLMMAGNWGQHAFIDAADPGNSYRNSITCINTRYIRRCFNDGYHIGHPLVANRHWTDMPGEFLANREKYAREGAIVFEGIDFFGVWALLMTRNWDALARRYVDLRESPRSHDEIVALLKSRVQRIDVSRPEVLDAVPA